MALQPTEFQIACPHLGNATARLQDCYGSELQVSQLALKDSNEPQAVTHPDPYRSKVLTVTTDIQWHYLWNPALKYNKLE